MKNAGSILEPACLYADQGEYELVALAETVKKYNCRNAVVHSGDVRFLEEKLDSSRIAVVVDFPYGRGENNILKDTIFQIANLGIRNFDICVNLAKALAGDIKSIRNDFMGVYNTLNEAFISRREIKAIIQLPYLWQYAMDVIDPLICALAESGVNIIKDWTTVHNFSRPIDFSLSSRVASLEHIKRIINLNHLSLKIKIAGGVRADNAVALVKRGADILGVGIQYVPDVIRSLELSTEI